LKGVPGHRIAAVSGDTCDVESMMALKDLMTALGSPNLDCRQDGTQYDTSARAGYLFNSTIAGIEKADAILLIGTFPRWEAPLVNARIRKRYLMGGLKVAVIGEQRDLTYPYSYLGAGPQTLQEVADGRHEFCDVLKNAKRPMLIVGMGAFKRADGWAVQAACRQVAEACNMIQPDWNGFNVLHTAAARVGALEIGFLPGEGGRGVNSILAGAGSGEIDVVYLLGADEIDTAKLGSTFVIYQGHHGDRGAHRADVILPGAAYTEKNGYYVNTEGRVQMGRMAAFPPGEAREDWKILRALSGVLGHNLPYDSISQLRKRLVDAAPIFARVDAVTPAEWQGFGRAGSLDPAPFISPVDNYYMTDPISRASVTMAKCTETFILPAREKTGTHG
jgi:NADH-quinone oxidoreductase subunit G